MTEPQFTDVLVVLNVPPTLEETVIDWLLGRDDSTGFTSIPVFGHSTRHEDLSLAEQVTGREERQQFQVQIAAGNVAAFMDDASRSLGAAGVHFWAIPLIAGGRLASPA